MAIVSCPFCGKKVSSKAASCQHCGQSLAEVSPEQLERLNRDNKLAKSQQINNHAMLATMVFIGSFMYFYFKEPEAGTWQSWMAHAGMTLGALSYLVCKARMIMFKRG